MFLNNYFNFFILIMARIRGNDDKIPDRGLGQDAQSTLDNEERHIGASASTTQSVGFPRGLYDTSVLVKYE